MDILIAIRRLESHNGIAVYLRRLAMHFHAHSTLFDIIVGHFRRVPGTEREVADLMDSARRVTICEELDPNHAVHKRAWHFFLRLVKYCIARIRVPSVVSTHSFDALVVCAVMARIFKNLKVIHTLHLSPKPNRVRSFNNLIGKVFIRRNPRVHFHATSSEIEQALLVACNIRAKQVKKIVYGVDPNEFRPPSAQERSEARNHLGIDDGRFCISIVGRVNAQKGHDFLLQALSKIPNATDRFVVVAVGGGSPEWLEKLATDYGLTKIVKPLGHAHPLKALWASDLFVLPSRWEGFALASLEAMACGLPVIRTNTAGAIDQIEEGQNGFVIRLEEADPLSDSLAEKIATIADSDSIRTRFGEASRQRAVSLFNQEALLEETRLYFLNVGKGNFN
jgi:glycosyltransferase involved in cell wall biosynthesis